MCRAVHKAPQKKIVSPKNTRNKIAWISHFFRQLPTIPVLEHRPLPHLHQILGKFFIFCYLKKKRIGGKFESYNSKTAWISHFFRQLPTIPVLELQPLPHLHQILGKFHCVKLAGNLNHLSKTAWISHFFRQLTTIPVLERRPLNKGQ